MKLRIKVLGETTAYRVDVDATGSLQELKRCAIQTISKLMHMSPSSLYLSLNKKDALPDGGESLSQLGLCSGDTLWVLGKVEGEIPTPGPIAGPSLTAAAQAVPSSGVMRPQEDSTGSKRTRQDGALAKDEEDPVKPGPHYLPAGLEPACAPLIALDSVGGGISAQPDPPDRDGINVSNSNTDTILDRHANGSESISRQQGEIVSGSSPRHPALDISPIDVSAGGEQAAAPCARNEMPLHTVPGHLKRVLSASISNLSAEGTEANGVVFSPHTLLLAAAHAAMLETGFLPSQEMPINVARPVSIFRMMYTWNHGGWNGTETTSASSSRPSLPPAPCHITASTTGPFLTLHVSVARSGAALSGISGKKITSLIHTLHLDTREHVARLEGSTASVAPPEAILPEIPPLSQYYCNLPGLWAALKEGLSMWCLSRCFQEAGLMPPVGWLMLPIDVKNQILAKLKVRELAMLASTCSEMRHLISAAEDLWETAYHDEFSHVSKADTEAELARLGCWRAAFNARWIQRVERRRREEDAMRLRPRLSTDPFFHGGPGAFPAPPPPGFMMPANIIGGDYDRLPGLGQGVVTFPSQHFGSGGLRPYGIGHGGPEHAFIGGSLGGAGAGGSLGRPFAFPGPPRGPSGSSPLFGGPLGLNPHLGRGGGRGWLPPGGE